MIVRWSLDELPAALAEAGIERPFLIASPRWQELDLPPHVARWTEVPSERVEVPPEADGILAVGGGSAIDTGKYASAQSGKPVVHVPTTYSGAEWTTFYGIRSPDRIIRGGGAGAHPVAIVYDVDLTLDLPDDVTAGTALNALAHCAEALYVQGHVAEGDVEALLGAPLIADALALNKLALAHALAQALGGTYGLPHGAMNALCLPPALEFNRRFVPDAVQRFGEAIGGDAVERSRALAKRGGFDRLRDFGVPEDDLPQVSEAAAQRAGNQANPRPATPAEILELLASIW